MSLLRSGSRRIVGIALSNRNIHMSSFGLDKKTIKLQAFQHYNFDDFLIYDFIILNLYEFTQIIFNFLDKYKIAHPKIIVSLDDNTHRVLYECINNQNKEISLNKEQNFLWLQEDLVFKDQKYSYLCSIPHTIIFQYTLFGIYTKLNIIKIIPQLISWYYAHKINIPELITAEIDSIRTLKSFLQTEAEKYYLSSIDISNYTSLTSETLLTALGLYFIGQDSYETI